MTAPGREMQQPDRRARRRAVTFVVCAAAFGAAAIVLVGALRPCETDSRPSPAIGWALLALLTAVPLGSAAWLWTVGARIVRANRFPPPDMPVLRATRVLEGRSARLRGRGAQLTAVVLAGAALALAVILGRLLLAIGRAAY